MSYKVHISKAAEKDLRAIFRYIAENLGSLINAARQLDRLDAEIASLSEMPERYRCYEIGVWSNYGLRIMPVDNYCVFYIPDKNKNTVEIIRVMYGGMDLERRLEEFAKEIL